MAVYSPQSVTLTARGRFTTGVGCELPAEMFVYIEQPLTGVKLLYAKVNPHVLPPPTHGACRRRQCYGPRRRLLERLRKLTDTIQLQQSMGAANRDELLAIWIHSDRILCTDFWTKTDTNSQAIWTGNNSYRCITRAIQTQQLVFSSIFTCVSEYDIRI